MGLLQKLLRGTPADEPAADTRGLLLFEHVSDVIQGETTLRQAGYDDIRVVAPPPALRTGCDLCLEIPLIATTGVTALLARAGITPLETMAIEPGGLEPTELCSITDFDHHVMVRAANMKIMVERTTGVIVNISGGGCSDVPYLAALLIGKTLDEAPSPRTAGYTLCAYTLGVAFDKAREVLACA